MGIFVLIQVTHASRQVDVFKLVRQLVSHECKEDNTNRAAERRYGRQTRDWISDGMVSQNQNDTFV